MTNISFLHVFKRILSILTDYHTLQTSHLCQSVEGLWRVWTAFSSSFSKEGGQPHRLSLFSIQPYCIEQDEADLTLDSQDYVWHHISQWDFYMILLSTLGLLLSSLKLGAHSYDLLHLILVCILKSFKPVKYPSMLIVCIRRKCN